MNALYYCESPTKNRIEIDHENAPLPTYSIKICDRYQKVYLLTNIKTKGIKQIICHDFINIRSMFDNNYCLQVGKYASVFNDSFYRLEVCVCVCALHDMLRNPGCREGHRRDTT